MSCSDPWRWSLVSSCSLSSSTILTQRTAPPSLLRVHRIGSRALLSNCPNAIQHHSPDKTLGLPSVLPYGALLAGIAVPAAKAVTGDNNVEEDLVTTLVTGGIAAPIIMNWLRLRWFKRGFLEMYFQFMFVFMFSPG